MDILTNKDYELIEELLEKCKKVHYFSFEGLLIKGLPVSLIKQYIEEKPSIQFKPWLIKKGLMLEKGLSKVLEEINKSVDEIL